MGKADDLCYEIMDKMQCMYLNSVNKKTNNKFLEQKIISESKKPTSNKYEEMIKKLCNTPIFKVKDHQPIPYVRKTLNTNLNHEPNSYGGHMMISKIMKTCHSNWIEAEHDLRIFDLDLFDDLIATNQSFERDIDLMILLKCNPDKIINKLFLRSKAVLDCLHYLDSKYNLPSYGYDMFISVFPNIEANYFKENFFKCTFDTTILEGAFKGDKDNIPAAILSPAIISLIPTSFCGNKQTIMPLIYRIFINYFQVENPKKSIDHEKMVEIFKAKFIYKLFGNSQSEKICILEKLGIIVKNNWHPALQGRNEIDKNWAMKSNMSESLWDSIYNFSRE